MSIKDDFLTAMSRAAATVSVVTTDGPAGRAGVTVSATTSVSADGPAPTMLACLNASSSAALPVIENRVFAINLLRADQQEIADVFASRIAPPDGDKFNATPHQVLATGAPCLSDALVSFDCRLERADLVSTHWVIIGAVEAVHIAEGDPLLYGMRRYLKPQLA